MRTVKSTLKSIMSKKEIKTGQIAEQLGMESLQLSVWLSRDDGKSIEKLIEVADALGCKIAFEDNKTGELFRV